MFTKTAMAIAPCLSDGPIARSGQLVVSASEQLITSRWSSVIRAWCVLYLFENMERIFKNGKDPVPALNESLESLAQFLHAAVHSGFRDLDGPREEKNGFSFFENADVKKVTGEHYGQLFKAFANTSYWDEPVKLLRQRLEKNGIAATDFQDKSVLDAGCGGGRYSVAWRLLGARPVVGFDISTTGITDARHRIAEVGIDDVHFEQGNVLELPFDDNTFDVVFSNGVLHHTTNWQQGVNEVVRVLRPNGFGWLYVIENPGGLYWDLIEVLRVVMKDEQHDVARSALQILDVPANRIFYMLDHVMVPINVRLTPEETEEGLRAAGATKIRRLERGTDFDLIERIYQKEPFAEIKYGVGENRYVFTKE